MYSSQKRFSCLLWAKEDFSEPFEENVILKSFPIDQVPNILQLFKNYHQIEEVIKQTSK